MLMSEFYDKGYTICEKMVEPELLDSIVTTVKAPFENIMQNWKIESMQELFEELCKTRSMESSVASFGCNARI